MRLNYRKANMPVRPPANLLGPLLLERDRLIYAVSQAINLAFRAADVGCTAPPGEVDRLVYFFAEGLPVIEDQFNLILEPHGVRAALSGIFCHQTPRVVPENQPGGRGHACELGDILFVTTYGRPLYKSILGNGLLVQAKEHIATVRGSLQEFLYEKAEAFKYQSPGRLAEQRRDLRECRHSLWYWGFDQRVAPYRMLEWRTRGVSARRPGHLSPGCPFEITLVDLLCGITGRRWHALPEDSAQTRWSKTVNDLVRVTANSAFNRRNSYIVGNRQMLRGEEAVRRINHALGPRSPFLVRLSLMKFLRSFGPEMEKIGASFGASRPASEEDDFKQQDASRFVAMADGSDEPPPNLGIERPVSPDNDDGGISFVVIDVSRITG
jgi:hypothetical protein